MPIANIAIIYEYLGFSNIAIKREWREYFVSLCCVLIRLSWVLTALIELGSQLCFIWILKTWNTSNVIIIIIWIEIEYFHLRTKNQHGKITFMLMSWVANRKSQKLVYWGLII